VGVGLEPDGVIAQRYAEKPKSVISERLNVWVDMQKPNGGNASPDHFVRANEYGLRDRYPKLAGESKIHHGFVLRHLLDRQLGLRPL
jgi:hypothetical protein